MTSRLSGPRHQSVPSQSQTENRAVRRPRKKKVQPRAVVNPERDSVPSGEKLLRFNSVIKTVLIPTRQEVKSSAEGELYQKPTEYQNAVNEVVKKFQELFPEKSLEGLRMRHVASAVASDVEDGEDRRSEAENQGVEESKEA